MLQGGGALGAYQAGVYQALHEAGLEPDWIIGTSIGAINASLIAGNDAGEPAAAIARSSGSGCEQGIRSGVLRSGRVSTTSSRTGRRWSTEFRVFSPRTVGPCLALLSVGRGSGGLYSTSPLERTLAELVDFNLVNHCTPRLTVGAAQVRTSEMRYLTAVKWRSRRRHIMALGALPPAFPAVRIDGELYWDGGIFRIRRAR